MYLWKENLVAIPRKATIRKPFIVFFSLPRRIISDRFRPPMVWATREELLDKLFFLAVSGDGGWF